MPGVMDLMLDKYLTVNEGKENTQAMSPLPGRVATPVFDIEDGPALQKMVHEAHIGSQEPSSRVWGCPAGHPAGLRPSCATALDREGN